MSEAERIRTEYARRAREIPADRYAPAGLGELYSRQVRERAVLALLRDDFLPLGPRRVLDVGCGGGQFLADFETWGAQRDRLAGIDLIPERAEQAERRLPGADIRTGDASELPWPNGHFQIVLQSVVFSSVLDEPTRQRIAVEMRRVLAPGGAILSYDFMVDNPRNPNVRGMRRRDIAALFPGFEMRSRRILVAPPLHRRLLPVSWLAVELLEAMRFLNTHLVALLRKA
jgi:SAM-dependent methyltransferase